MPFHTLSYSSRASSFSCRASSLSGFEGVTNVTEGEMTIREAMVEEYWEVADVHCSSFFPSEDGRDGPLQFILRTDRVGALLANLGMPSGIKKKCLVAISPSGSGHRKKDYDGESAIWGGPIFRPLLASLIVGVPSLVWISSGHGIGPQGILGTVTVDTAAEFLLRRQPGRKRRQSTAYISNMAVRSSIRRKGAARKLLENAENLAKSWGCGSIALHCDQKNKGAIGLYLSSGYRIIKEPLGSIWPRPWCEEGIELVLMLKLLSGTRRNV